MAFVASQIQTELLERLSANKFGSDWMIQLEDEGSLPLAEWLAAKDAENRRTVESRGDGGTLIARGGGKWKRRPFPVLGLRRLAGEARPIPSRGRPSHDPFAEHARVPKPTRLFFKGSHSRSAAPPLPRFRSSRGRADARHHARPSASLVRLLRQWQFDLSDRYVLGMAVDFEHRSPRPDDKISIGMVDLRDGDRWIELGESLAWCWQQGCMLQWLPGSDREVIWNDRRGDRFVSRILDVQSRKSRVIPFPVYAVSPDGRTAVTPDFRRINDVRPGYGYAGPVDPLADDLAPKEGGIHRVDLQTGKAELILSLADIARMGRIPNPQPGIKHYFNHLLFSPTGERFIALHRWRYPNGSAVDANDHSEAGRFRRPHRLPQRIHLSFHLARRDFDSRSVSSLRWKFQLGELPV